MYLSLLPGVSLRSTPANGCEPFGFDGKRWVGARVLAGPTLRFFRGAKDDTGRSDRRRWIDWWKSSGSLWK